MLYLILAIFTSSLFNIMVRVSESRVDHKLGLTTMNYVSCCTVAGLEVGFTNILPIGADGFGTAILFGLLGGIAYLTCITTLQVSAVKNGVVLSGTFMKMGLLVPTATAIIVFHERPEMLQVIGFVLAVIAILMINLDKEQTNLKFKSGLVILLLAAGIGDAASKFFEEWGNAALNSQFLLYTFGTAGILCFILVLIKGQRIGLKEIMYGVMVGVPNYYSSKFLLVSLNYIPAVIAFPSFSVGCIVVITLAGLVLFKERLNKKQWVALAVIMVALALLNM